MTLIVRTYLNTMILRVGHDNFLFRANAESMRRIEVADVGAEMSEFADGSQLPESDSAPDRRHLRHRRRRRVSTHERDRVRRRPRMERGPVGHHRRRHSQDVSCSAVDAPRSVTCADRRLLLLLLKPRPCKCEKIRLELASVGDSAKRLAHLVFGDARERRQR